MGEIIEVGVPDIVQFHGKPGNIAFPPEVKIRDGNLQFDYRIEFAPHVGLKGRPADIFAAVDRIPDGVGIVRHVLGHRGEISFRVRLHEQTQGRFRIKRLVG